MPFQTLPKPAYPYRAKTTERMRTTGNTQCARHAAKVDIVFNMRSDPVRAIHSWLNNLSQPKLSVHVLPQYPELYNSTITRPTTLELYYHKTHNSRTVLPQYPHL